MTKISFDIIGKQLVSPDTENVEDITSELRNLLGTMGKIIKCYKADTRRGDVRYKVKLEVAGDDNKRLLRLNTKKNLTEIIKRFNISKNMHYELADVKFLGKEEECIKEDWDEAKSVYGLLLPLDPEEIAQEVADQDPTDEEELKEYISDAVYSSLMNYPVEVEEAAENIYAEIRPQFLFPGDEGFDESKQMTKKKELQEGINLADYNIQLTGHEELEDVIFDYIKAKNKLSEKEKNLIKNVIYSEYKPYSGYIEGFWGRLLSDYITVDELNDLQDELDAAVDRLEDVELYDEDLDLYLDTAATGDLYDLLEEM